MFLNITCLLAFFGICLLGALASPVTPRENASFHDHSLTRREPPALTVLDDLFDGTLGNLPILWMVSQGALASFLSAEASRSDRRPKDPAALNIENGAFMAEYVANMLTAPVEQYGHEPFIDICEPVIDGKKLPQPPAIDPATVKAIHGGDPLPDEFEQLLMPLSFTGKPLGAVISTSLTSALCETFKKHAFNKVEPKNSPEFPQRREVHTLEGLIISQGNLLNMQDLLLESALTSVSGQLKRMYIARQFRDVFSLVEQYGMLKSFWYINREIVRQLLELANLAHDRDAFAKTGPAMKAFRSLIYDNAGKFGVKPETYAVKTNDFLEAFTGAAKTISTTLKVAKDIPELGHMLRVLAPELRLLDWHLRKRIQEQQMIDNGPVPDVIEVEDIPFVGNVPIHPPRV